MDSEFRIENTHVPDKVYAYMIQAHHMLYELVDCKSGDSVSIEVFDDNGVMREDGTVEAIQIKSAVSERNPVSNRAVDLWKTLYNWLMAIKEGELDPDKTKYKLFITVNKTGTIVSAFNDATDNESAEIAWEMARGEFYDEEDNEKEMASTYEAYVRAFFDIENKSNALIVIKNFTLETCETAYSEKVKDKLKKLFPYDDIFEVLYKALVGWCNSVVTECVENHKPIIATYDEFAKEGYILFRECNQRDSLKSLNSVPDDETVDNEFRVRRCYIAQLELINEEYENILMAVNDYFCAAVDRAKWAKDGIVSKQQFLDYDANLKRNWQNKKRIVKSERFKGTDEEYGYRVYSYCMDSKVEMNSHIVPDSFYAGCMHALSDQLEIGWHPDYKKILGEKDEDESE